MTKKPKYTITLVNGEEFQKILENPPSGIRFLVKYKTTQKNKSKKKSK